MDPITTLVVSTLGGAGYCGMGPGEDLDNLIETECAEARDCEMTGREYGATGAQKMWCNIRNFISDTRVKIIEETRETIKDEIKREILYELESREAARVQARPQSQPQPQQYARARVQASAQPQLQPPSPVQTPRRRRQDEDVVPSSLASDSTFSIVAAKLLKKGSSRHSEQTRSTWNIPRAGEPQDSKEELEKWEKLHAMLEENLGANI